MSNSFIEQIAPLVQKYPSKIFNSVTIAQACLESAFGQSDLARGGRNLFGIKASAPWTGPVFNKDSLEERAGVLKPENSDFRSYSTIEESIADHATFMESTEYRKQYYSKVLNASTPEEQAEALTGTYATDSRYGQKLINFINQYNLKQYDAPAPLSTQGGSTVTIAYPEIINDSMFGGMAGRRPTERPKYYIMHNDAGGANYLGYRSWLKSRIAAGESDKGFAHYYIDRKGILRVEDTYNGTWSCANYDANMNSIGYEVNEQLKASDEEFLANEDMVLRQMAEDMTYYGDTPNSSNIRFHNEFSSTSCPARSLELHGGSNESLRRYVIDRIKYYQSLGSTVQEMIDAENGGATKATKQQTGWISKIEDGKKRWWFRNEDGSYKKSEWYEEYGNYYYFDDEGWAAQNGIKEIDGKKYHFGPNCVMTVGWKELEDKWYHFNRRDGYMETKTMVEGKDGRLYYLTEDGSMLSNTDVKVAADGSLIEKATGNIVGKF